jgi:hypothetical protein
MPTARAESSQLIQEALALVRVKGCGWADGFMMMGVAFLLERSGLVVDSQTVADEDPAGNTGSTSEQVMVKH